MKYSRYRPAAVKLIDSLENDPNVEIVPLSENLFWRAFQLYRDRSDKEWGLIDCVSFVVMKDREIRDALTVERTVPVASPGGDQETSTLLATKDNNASSPPTGLLAFSL